MRKFIFLFIFLCTFLFSTEWTVMVYLDGDNNLEDAAIDDFLEMSSVGSVENVINIVVQFDRIEGYNTKHGNWTICHRFYITTEITPEESNAISDWGDGKGGREVNMGDSDTLTDFINWAKENYPASHYALILWNHGGGWRNLYQPPGKKPPVVKEVCYDDTDNDYLSVKEVKEAIENKGVDLIGFDACLMGMIEVADEIKNGGTVLVASEETELSTGWDYEKIFENLKKNPNSSPEQLGKIIVDSFDDETLSGIDLTRIDNLITSLNSVIQEIMNYQLWLDVYIARSDTKNFDEPSFVDLYDFLDKLSENTQNETVISEIEEFKNIFAQTVFADNTPNDTSYGLSIYFPDYGETIDPDYNEETISFPFNSCWDEFLISFLNSELFSDFTLVFSEDFSEGLPQNWTVIDGYNDGKTWTDENPGERNLYLTFPFMIVDSDRAGEVDMDEQLITPSINLSGYSTVYLEFESVFEYYDKGINEIGDVDIKVEDGNWQNIKRFSGEDKEGKVIVNISNLASGKTVKIRWHYYNAYYDWYWAIDNVKIWAKEAEKGDINADGKIDISDVILCLRMAVGLDPVNLTLADMNNDGTVDISDVIFVLRKAVGLD